MVKKRGRTVILIVVVLIALQATVYLPRHIAPPPPLSWIIRPIPYVANVIRNTFEAIAKQYHTYIANIDAAKHASRLAEENERLRFALSMTQIQTLGQQALFATLGWTASPWDGPLAQVIFYNTAERYRTLWIKAFGSYTLTNGQAVLDEHGLLGKIIQTQGSLAQVLLVQDVDHAFDVISDSGVRGIIQGTGGEFGRLLYVPQYENIALGETLRTTGRDLVYPEHLPVGVVAHINRSPEKLYLDIDVTFYAKPWDANYVRILPTPTGQNNLNLTPLISNEKTP